MAKSKITTDQTLRETAAHGASSYPFAYYPENTRQFALHRIDWHWHNELELLLAEQGDLLCLVGPDRVELKQGCAIFINSGVLHRFEAKGGAFIPNIVFAPSLLAAEDTRIYSKYIAPVLACPAMYQLLDPQTEWQAQVIRLLRQIFLLQQAAQADEWATWRALLDIWGLLLQNMDLAAGGSGVRRLSSQQAKLQTMLQYIHDHYAQEVTLGEIAAAAFMSKSGALHIFRSVLHTAPVAYLIRYRLAKAAERLQTTQDTVAEVAASVGFADAGYFCRQFRRCYHISPTGYRKSKSHAGLAANCPPPAD